MEFSIQKDKLLAELTLAAAVVEKKTTIPILSTVKISATAQNAIQISASDLSTSLITTIDADVKEPGAVCLPSVRLAQLVRTFPDGPVKFKVGENYWASISAGKTRARLAGIEPSGFPEMPAPPNTGVPINAAMLGRQMDVVSYAISDKSDRFTLNGLLLTLGDSLTTVATDGHRMSWASVKMEPTPPQSVLVPKAIPAHYQRIIDGAEDGAQVIVSTDENHIYFTVGDRLLISRKLSGNFPDYQRVMPKPDSQIISRTFARLELKSALSQVLQFADDTTRAISIEVMGDGARVFANTVDKGECEAELTSEGQGEITFCLAGQYLLETLDAISADRVRLLTKDNLSALEWRADGRDDYRAIIMPMRK